MFIHTFSHNFRWIVTLRLISLARIIRREKGSYSSLPFRLGDYNIHVYHSNVAGVILRGLKVACQIRQINHQPTTTQHSTS